MLETLFAAARIGAICVLINARLAPGEAEFVLSDCEASALVFGREQADAAVTVATRIGIDVIVDVDDTGAGQPYAQITAHDPVAEVNCGLDDPAVLM